MKNMFERLLEQKYGLHFIGAEKSAVGAGSDTWFIDCREGKFVMKFPSESDINRPEQEPELCEFLEKRGIPVCSFLRDKSGDFLSEDDEGRRFTLQKFISGICPDWNTATDDILNESAEMLGKIHTALKDYPPLPVGIGQDFFRFMTPERASESYRRSLKIAEERGESEIAGDLKWRLSLVGDLPWKKFDFDRLTVRNTHGDYFISQFICENGHLKAVIDWTTACVHPVVWEIMRSFVYGSPKCADGTIDEEGLKRYVEGYCRFGALNDYDLQNLRSIFYYQIAVCDYYGQYYASTASNRGIYLRQAIFSTKLLKNRAKNA